MTLKIQDAGENLLQLRDFEVWKGFTIIHGYGGAECTGALLLGNRRSLIPHADLDVLVPLLSGFPPAVKLKNNLIRLEFYMGDLGGAACLHGKTVIVQLLLCIFMVQLALGVHAYAPFPSWHGNLGHGNFPQKAADDFNARVAIHTLFGKAGTDEQKDANQPQTAPSPTWIGWPRMGRIHGTPCSHRNQSLVVSSFLEWAEKIVIGASCRGSATGSRTRAFISPVV